METGKKSLLLIVSSLVLCAIPVLLFSEQRQTDIQNFIAGDYFANHKLIAVAVIIGLFASDILLPIPSSAVCTMAGNLLGVFLGTIVCWVGLNLSAFIGYGFGYLFGWRAVIRFSNEKDALIVRRQIQRWGIWPIVFLRAIPVLSEASVLLVGTYRFPVGRFLPAVGFANLIFALSFVALGRWYSDEGQLWIGIVISCTIPTLLLLFWGFVYRNAMSTSLN